ncbi:hypothetical protein DAETH_39340 (plasmid) [Deinococcus aetherius]|uniref:LPXTG cell wall anchor domain-containing protein n=1 Tax=Deinococcus aetherius TaxID=200252 RepID=A0ABM8AJI2_9DEIO|nr:hypothetical protein [Deinococcus aetherius]BDP43965.1 hypothetical protein DAETH_39340 [Deinococcus aetherius]
MLEPGVGAGGWAWLLLPGAAVLVGAALLLTRGRRDRGTPRLHLWPE